MWGLLQPSLLTGEGGYYLTTLSSAVLVLKNFKTSLQPHTMEVRQLKVTHAQTSKSLTIGV